MVCDYEYDEESETLRVNCLGCIYGSSIEDFDVCMAKVIDKLLEIKRVVRLVLAETREHEYDFSEVRLLLEIANAIEKITRDKIISLRNIVVNNCESEAPERYMILQNILTELKYDPLDAYRQLLREIRHIKIKMEKESDRLRLACYGNYLNNALFPMQNILEKCEMIRIAKPDLAKHKNRSLYRTIFHPSIRPNFMYTRYVSTPPPNAELLERYSIGKTDVEIYSLPGKVRKLYHIIPQEFRLNDKEYMLLENARKYIGRHEPRELVEPERVRDNLFRIGLDMLRDLAKNSGMEISDDRLKELADILTRYTAGFGILELILEDENVQDVSVNSPIGQTPVYIFHGVHEQCETNIVPSMDDAESWATRFRLLSGRPLDEASPVLDTEMNIPGGRARVAAITRSLSPEGLAFAFRRHRDKPWTLPLFITSNMLDAFSAALIWFLIDGARTILIAGTRSSGKTSFLGSCMVQIMPKLRVITTEDTLELPVTALRNLGYNVERLKSRSVITHVETELPAEEALRTALRLGDSCLIMGEVRSTEALALYEAMRIGALANVVAGTIHGDSSYGVFDRVVNDLKVPPTSFKATDIIIICNMLKTPDGLHSFRRVVELTEVRKHWKTDPQDEGGFVNLLEYSAKEDKLKPTKTLLMGESSVLNDIASRVREWKGRWDAVWDNIKLRERILQTIVDEAKAKNNPELLEAPFVVQSNNQFHILSNSVREEIGDLNNEMIYDRWLQWMQKQ